MESIHFEREIVPARTISLHELHETYARHHPKKDVRDANNTKKAFELLLERFPNSDTSTFTALSFLEFKEHLVEKGYARVQCNKLLKFVRQVFNWADVYDLVPSRLVLKLNRVPLLQPGEARENTPRQDVPRSYVEAIQPHLRKTIADMLEIQLLASMRPSEVCRMKAGDIKRTPDEIKEIGYLIDEGFWIYDLRKHKSSRFRKGKAVLLGEEEQGILGPLLMLRTPDEPVFKNSRGRAFHPNIYAKHIREAIEEHNLPKFTPYQLRHTGLTVVSARCGRDVARAVAGHTSEATTAIYDHSDIEKAKLAIRSRRQQSRTEPPEPVGPAFGTTLRVFSGE